MAGRLATQPLPGIGWAMDGPSPRAPKAGTSRAEISFPETTRYNQKTYPGGRSEGSGRSHEGSKDASLHLGDRSGVYSLESSTEALMVRDVCGRTRRFPFLIGMPPLEVFSSVRSMHVCCVFQRIFRGWPSICKSLLFFSVNPAKVIVPSFLHHFDS